jgi:chaperonin GroEL
MMWQLRDKVGDGTVTAAVLFQAIFDGGLRYIAAGGNAQRLRYHLNKVLVDILRDLDAVTTPVNGKQALTRVAHSICYDLPLAKIIGEIFDIIGEYGQLDIRTGRRRGLDREYVEGSYWPGGVLSRSMLRDSANLSVELDNTALVLTNLEIDEPLEMAPVMRAALQAEMHHVVIVARKVSDKVIGFLLTNTNPDKFELIVVKTPGSKVEDQAAALTDMAVLTGGTPFFLEAGQTLEHISVKDLGQARTVWANRFNFGIRGGQGDARKLRDHLRSLQAGYDQMNDLEVRRSYQQRIGKLMGGSATLHIGAATEAELKTRKALAERTANAIRGAVRDGVLPGGGAALLSCSHKLRSRGMNCAEADERAAYRIIADALEQPMRVILSNAGYDASAVMGQIDRKRGDHTMNVESGEIVNVAKGNIFDVAAVQKAAVKSAIGTAALALTIDVMVHRKKQREAASLTPGKSNDFYGS